MSIRGTHWMLAAAAVVSATARAAPADPLLDAIGAPKEPAYVYYSELEDASALRFRRPKDQQVARRGGRALRVREGARYLWVIDAKGAVRIAPEMRDDSGVEITGHPNLTLGGPARLAGVLTVRDGVATLDSDSGRFGYMDASMKAENLEAAARWISSVGLVNAGGSKLPIRTRFVPPVFDKSSLGPHDRADLKMAEHVARFGGYILLPPRGKSRASLPRQLRSSSARLAWSKRARSRWRRGRAPSHERHRRGLPQRSRTARRAR